MLIKSKLFYNDKNYNKKYYKLQHTVLKSNCKELLNRILFRHFFVVVRMSRNFNIIFLRNLLTYFTGMFCHIQITILKALLYRLKMFIQTYYKKLFLYTK